MSAAIDEAAQHWLTFKAALLNRFGGWPSGGIEAMQGLNRLLTPTPEPATDAGRVPVEEARELLGVQDGMDPNYLGPVVDTDEAIRAITAALQLRDEAVRERDAAEAVSLLAGKAVARMIAERAATEKQLRECEAERDGLLTAARNIKPYLEWTISDESPGHHPTMPSAVAEFLANIPSRDGGGSDG